MVIAIICAVSLLNDSFDIFGSGEYLHMSGKRSSGVQALIIAVGFFAISVYTIIFIVTGIAKKKRKWNEFNQSDKSKNVD